MFIGRTEELNFLNEHYQSNSAEFITLYGRRRVGKTELLSEFSKDKNVFYYTCNEYTDKKQLETFANALFDYDYSIYKNAKRFDDWFEVFSSFEYLSNNTKTVIIIDEFPYMVKANKSIPSILQNLWDLKLSKLNIMLIVSGSSMSFIEDDLLASKNPLYGRMTGIYKLAPLPFYDAIKFFPNYSSEDKIIAYSILGGIPHYLKQFSPTLSLEDNIKKNILKKGCILFNEVEYILHQELREPAVYNTILEAIGIGNCKFNEVCNRSHIESNNISPYLKNLTSLGLIKRELPVIHSLKDNVKQNQGEYSIADNFFRFWYSYVYQFSSELERGYENQLFDRIIKKDLHKFSSKPFENISIDYLYHQNNLDKLPFWFSHIGRWWGNSTKIDENGKQYTTNEEVDILAFDNNSKNFIVGECKFTNEPIDLAQYTQLKKKLSLHGNVYYYLFSLSGFSKAIEDLSLTENLKLLTIDNIISL